MIYLDILGISCLLFCVQLASPMALSHQFHKFERKVLASDEPPPYCPNAEDFAPCICVKDDYQYLITADCSAVQNVSELVQAFQIDFPDRFYQFTFHQNKQITTLPSGVFGGAQFSALYIGDTNLQTIEEGALTTLTSVRYIQLMNSHITEFPWNDLEKMTSLELLWMYDNMYTSLPSFDPADGIKSNSLKRLAFGSPQLTELPTFEEGSMAKVYGLEFYDSPIGSIPEGHFSKLEGLQWLDLVNLGLEELKSNTLVFSDTANIKDLFLRNNNISNVEQGAIQFSSGMYVDIHNNTLTSLEEDVWRPLLDLGGSMDVRGNPLPCDCSLAWVIRNFQFKVLGTCPDGTLFYFLDPAMFDDC